MECQSCGCSSVVEHELPKLGTGVRFPSPALTQVVDSGHRCWAAGAPGEDRSFAGDEVIFSDRTIKEAIAVGRIEIDPFEASYVQPSSVDLRVDRYFRVFENHKYPYIDPKAPQLDLTTLVEVSDEEPFILHPGEFVLGSTFERVRLGNDVVARLEGKSSLGRIGLLIHSTAGFVDPGFDGYLTLELSNVANLPIAIYPQMKIGQISFYQLSTEADHPYGTDTAGSKYQGQRGPTASRIHEDFA